LTLPFASVVLALAASLAACSATPERPFDISVPRALEVDFLHYDIALSIDHEAGYVNGDVGVRFAALDAPVEQLVLDAVDLRIERVLDDQNRSLRFETGADTLTIHLAQALPAGAETEVFIAYDAFPQRGLYFVEPAGRDPGRPWQVWSQGQCHETRHWVPVWDQLSDRASHTLALTVDDRFMTLGAGELVDSVPVGGGGRRTDTWSMTTPHPAYLITLIIGELGSAMLIDGPVPLPVIARQRDLAAALHATRRTADMVSFLREFTGRDYPYPKYSQAFVDNFTAGGMENISATTMYDEGLHGIAEEPQVDITGLVAHELAHQWFGNLLSCRDWSHLWINEGWADYAELLYLGRWNGADAMGAAALGYQRSGCQAELDASRPVVWPDYRDPDDTFDDHNYNGAAARIRLLADVLGEDVFRTCVRAWMAWAEERQVDTDDLQRVFEETSGSDLSRFFDEWFRFPGYPRFAVAVEPGPVLVARQVQGDDGWREVFDVTLQARWSRGGIEHEARLSCAQVETRLELTGEGELDWVCFDSGHVLPGEIELTQGQDAWAAQLATAEDAVIRLLAAQWFDGDRWVAHAAPPSSLTTPAVEALSAAARGDSFVQVRIAALSALSLLGDEQIVPLLAELAEDDDARVRELAMLSLGAHVGAQRDLRPLLRAGLHDDSASVVVAAATALADADEPGLLATLRQLIDDWDAVRLDQELVRLASELDDPARVPFLMGVARQHPERWVRAAAVTGLGAWHGEHGAAVFRQLCLSLQDESHDVRAAAAHALGLSGDPRALRHLQARWDLEPDPTVLSALEFALRQLD
jgi:aminopeptidase N